MCVRESEREGALLAIHKTAKTLENAQHENLRGIEVIVKMNTYNERRKRAT